MTEELSRIEKWILNSNGQKITNIITELECGAYHGLNFIIDRRNIKFRKAKITPKKVGLFVTLWKRNDSKETEPFNVNDNFDFYIIVTEEENNFGFFFFPKSILSEKEILTNNKKEGKRGFRVYPSWAKTANKRAGEAQSWQTTYFINMANNEQDSIDNFNSIFSENT